MRASQVRGDAPLGRAVQEAQAQQERLVDVLDGLRLLRQHGCQGLDADRAAAELLDDGRQELAVRGIQALVVYLESGQRLVRGGGVHVAIAVDLGVIAHAAQQPVHDSRRPAPAAGDGRGPVRAELHVEQPRGPFHDRRQVRQIVEVEAVRGSEAVAERAGDAARAGGRAHQREGLEGEPQASRRGPLADHDVQREILHCRVEDLLHRAIQAVNLVDEEHVALVQRSQDGRQIPRPLDRRAAGVADVGAQLAGHDRRQGGLAQTGRAVQQDVIRRVPSLAGGAEQDPEVGLQLALADVFVQGSRPQRPVDGDLDLVLHAGREYSRDVGHRALSLMRAI